MRSALLLFFLLTMGTLGIAQPANDDCIGLIDLGVVPACTPAIYTNVSATASNIGFGNNPSCFNGGTTQRDVWFSFTTTDDLTDITITLIGVLNGPNADAILNPQIALYRGDCELDGLAELSCISAPAGATQIQLDILGLTPNIPYYIRVNDYSATASPNSGDFTLCVDEYVPAINIGSSPGTTACFGTLYDSGGPDNDYGNGENATFVICPNDFHACIELMVDNFSLEPNFDFINVYAGSDINAPLITSINGTDNGQEFLIQATSQCVTVQFTSDGSAVDEGFVLTWQCSPLACSGNSIDNPGVINSIPFTQNGASTCNGAATFAETPCNNVPFINGPQFVYAYNSPGDICGSIVISGAGGGTGVLVLNGLPDDPNTVCIAQSNTGNIPSANFETPGTYYIVVSNPSGCTGFNISIQETVCLLLPSLANALCNPLNGCVEEGVPSLFTFEDGFQDIDVTTAINGGCWLGLGAEPDFYWFTIEAQADGPLGFIMESPDPSDIDFNVWGPFTPEQVCETPGQIINFISNNQPIRSSWAAGADPSGLADIHPILGTPVTDFYDCGATPGAGGDDFVATIPAQQGEVYVILVNDFGEGISTSGMQIDWSPSSGAVLFPPTPEVAAGDTAVCSGETVQIEVISSVNSIQWVGASAASLSCSNCFTPVASPTQTTTYQALIEAVCYTDTIKVTVQVFDVDAGPDRVVCRGEEITLQAGEFYNNAVYNWTVPAGLQFSCTDCPNPVVTAIQSGVYPLTISLDAAGCDLQDVMTLTVLNADAAQYNISDNLQICEGETVNLGGTAVPGVTYNWTSAPTGFTSVNPNPVVTPSQTTTYYLSALNATCPVPSMDSVLVEVFALPVISVVSDTAVCQSSSIVLGNTTPEPGVTYLWTGPSLIEDPTDPNTTASPESPGTYTLTATRGGCSATESLNVTITAIAISIQQTEDIRICQGESVTLSVNITPANASVVWTPNNGSLNTNIGNTVIATPETFTRYIARVNVPGCFKTDTIRIVVDSLPSNLAIMPSDTTICQGNPVVLKTPTYEPSDFMGISFQWTPDAFSESSDTLLNFVVTPDTTINYTRITRNGVCVDTSIAHIQVNEIPIATVVPTDTVICVGQAVQLTASFNRAVDEISWAPTEGLSCTDCLNPVAMPLGTTVYTVTGKIMDCPGSASARIEVLSLPAINLNAQRVICEGDNIQLAFNPDPTATYSWTSTDPAFVPTTDPTPVVSPDADATYTVVAQNAGCGTTAEISIVVNEIPVVTLVPSDTIICAGQAVQLSAAFAAPVDEISWTPAEGLSCTDCPAPVATPSVTTIYSVIGNNMGCADGATVQVEVVALPTITLSTNRTICEGDNIQLASDPDLTATYSWTSTDPAFVPTSNPTPIVSPDATATYTVVAENAGCSVTSDITIDVVQLVTLQVSASTDLICLGNPITLTATVSQSSAGETFEWTTANGGSFSGASVTFIPGQTDTYFLEYTSGNECQTLFNTLNVTVLPNISVNIVVTDSGVNILELPLGQEVNLTAVIENQSASTPTITWSGGTYVSTNGEQAVVQPTENGTLYIVEVTTPEGCIDRDTILFNIVPPVIKVPKAFTPNGDDRNNVFRLLHSGLIKEIVEFKIYNRWGQVVYEATNNEGWDGTQKGKPAPSDVYIYRIVVKTFDEVVHEKKGDVTLLR